MNQEKQYIEFWKFIGILHQADLLRHLILIGSWAEYIYAQSGILPGYDANLRTLDVDFLIQMYLSTEKWSTDSVEKWSTM